MLGKGVQPASCLPRRHGASAHEVYDHGLVGILAEIHQRLADAYGWPVDLSDEEILQRLFDLNHQRAAEEEQGTIRYLRPAF